MKPEGDSSAPVRIAMGSGPRNISTAMMRSFGSRSDCGVTDEPFYGAYLKDSGEPQPMAGTIIADMDCDWHSVKNTLCGAPPNGKAIWYQKHMPHHMVGEISISDFPDHKHAFLIRDPAFVVASYAAKRVKVTPDNLGYARQVEYIDRVAQITGERPPVLDSTDILRDPEGHLKALCKVLNIEWDAAMLGWEPGRRDTDGVWGTHWYNRVIETTGFGEPQTSVPRLTPDQQLVVDACRADYETMCGTKITI